jgi:hypothetical protein
MKNKCHKIEKIMGLYIYDELPGKDKNAFETHVNTCPNCTAKLAEFKKTHEFITEKHAPTPTPDWDQSWLNIRKRLIDHQKQEKRNGFHIPMLRWAGALVGSAAIFLLGLLVGTNVKDTPTKYEIPDAASAYILQEFQEHIENIKPVIIEYANYWRSADTPPDLPVEKERVIHLLMQNQMLLCRIPVDNNRYMQQLLNELNGILTKIALMTWEDPGSLSHIKKMIRKKGLLFKMEALRPAKETEMSL